jgi:hypothetical protein
MYLNEYVRFFLHCWMQQRVLVHFMRRKEGVMNKLRLPVEDKCGHCSESNVFVYVSQTNRRSGHCAVRYSWAEGKEALSVNRKNRSKSAKRIVKGSVLGMLLVPSALLTALAVGSADYSWFAWFGLLPLFFAIRILSPAVAALAGAFWGGCFYFFLVTGAIPNLLQTPHSFILLAIVLMLYAYSGGLLTRWVGFSPMLLALSWILVELTLKPLGLRQGLLAGTQSTNGFLHWISCLLGYAFVAMIVAGANAWLVLLLSSARLRIPPPAIPTGLPNAELYPLSQTSLQPQFLTICEIYPRPPPGTC